MRHKFRLAVAIATLGLLVAVAYSVRYVSVRREVEVLAFRQLLAEKGLPPKDPAARAEEPSPEWGPVYVLVTAELASRPEWRLLSKAETEGLNEEEWTAVAAFLREQEIVLGAAREVGEMASCDFHHQWSNAGSWGNLLLMAGRLQAHQGALDGALDDVLSAWQLAELLKAEARIGIQLTRCGIQERTALALRDLATPGALSGEQLTRVAGQLGKTEYATDFVRGLASEGEDIVEMFEEIREGKVPYRSPLTPDQPLLRPLLNWQEVQLIRSMTDILAFAEFPYYAQADKLRVVRERDQRGPMRMVWSQIAGTLPDIFERRARAEAWRDMGYFAMQLEQYRLQEGAYPDALDWASRSGNGVGTPRLDPFSGDYYVYKPSPGNFMLYSVGPNRRDDSGTPESDDLVWRGKVVGAEPAAG